MRYTFIFILFMGLSLLLTGDEEEVNYVQRMKQISAEIKQIKKTTKSLGIKQKKLFMEMHKVRVKLLKSDPELSDLHRKIMALHKELALKLDKNKEMAVLKKQAENIEIQLEDLYRKHRTLKERKINIDNILNPKEEKK